MVHGTIHSYFILAWQTTAPKTPMSKLGRAPLLDVHWKKRSHGEIQDLIANKSQVTTRAQVVTFKQEHQQVIVAVKMELIPLPNPKNIWLWSDDFDELLRIKTAIKKTHDFSSKQVCRFDMESNQLWELPTNLEQVVLLIEKVPPNFNDENNIYKRSLCQLLRWSRQELIEVEFQHKKVQLKNAILWVDCGKHIRDMCKDDTTTDLLERNFRLFAVKNGHVTWVTNSKRHWRIAKGYNPDDINYLAW